MVMPRSIPFAHGARDNRDASYRLARPFHSSIENSKSGIVSKLRDLRDGSFRVVGSVHGVAAHDDISTCSADAFDRLHADAAIDLDEQVVAGFARHRDDLRDLSSLPSM